MRGLGWLALTVLFLAASWGFAARTAILDLRRDREWQPVAWPAEGGELNGVRAAIVALDAVSTPVRPDRALVHLRMSLDGPEPAREAWIDCRPTLRDGKGRVWSAVLSAETDGAIKAIASDGHNHGYCSPMPYNAPAAGPILSDQVFLVPVDALGDLDLHLSGSGVRPQALVSPIRPVPRLLR